jgi:hypothetical protein
MPCMAAGFIMAIMASISSAWAASILGALGMVIRWLAIFLSSAALQAAGIIPPDMLWPLPIAS